MRNIGLVLLAAGYSRRFLGDKRLVEIQGVSLLNRSILCAEQVSTIHIQHKVLVQRPGDQNLQVAGDWILACPEAQRQGMGYSIAAGVSKLTDCDAVLIMLADMPFVRPATLEQLAVALKQHPQVRPVYKGRLGHPVGFSRDFFPALIACEGDQGARNVIQQDLLYRLPVDDPGVITDIDTREQWREFVD